MTDFVDHHHPSLAVARPCPPQLRRAAWILAALLLLLAPGLFGQAAVGNEKFDQKEYQAAIDAYEKVPQAMREATTLNRLGISYHMLNRLRPAENAYKAAVGKDPKNATLLNNLAALYYSQGKFSD